MLPAPPPRRRSRRRPLVPLLDRLIAAGMTLGIATNDAEAPARAHLERAGMLDRFAFVAGYDSGHGAKPQPGHAHAPSAAATGIPPADCAMIGDSTHDLDSGRAAGMAAVAVLTGIAEHADLAPHADVVLESIGALPGWLGLPPEAGIDDGAQIAARRGACGPCPRRRRRRPSARCPGASR